MIGKAPPPLWRSQSCRKFHIVSLGCAKNTVDSDGMAHVLAAAGYRPTDRPADADIVIVNTCGFIAAAREESLGILRDLAKGKKDKQLLIAAGCMAQRDGEAMPTWVPKLDGVIGTRRWTNRGDCSVTVGSHLSPVSR